MTTMTVQNKELEKECISVYLYVGVVLQKQIRKKKEKKKNWNENEVKSNVIKLTFIH